MRIKRRNEEEGTDIIKVELSAGLNSNALEYLREGATIGVKANLQTKDGNITVHAEKLTFINTKQH